MLKVSTSLDRDVSGRIYPDGSFGYCKRRRTDKVGTEDFRSKYLLAVGEVEGLFGNGGLRLEALKRMNWQWWLPLGLSNLANSHKIAKPRAKRGSKGLTSHGRRQVYCAADFIQWRIGRGRVSFLTLTLPDFNPSHNAAVALAWPEAIRQITQWIRRRLRAKNLLDWVASASEIQPGRFKRTKALALHQHFVFAGRGAVGGWKITPKEVRGAWRRIIKNLLPIFADSDFSASENLQVVRKSASAYLAKYLSKGSCPVGDVESSSRGMHPSSWYSITRSLSMLILRSVRSTGEAVSLARNASRERCHYHRSLKLELPNGAKHVIGGFGKLKPGWSEFVGPPVCASVPLSVAPSVCGPIPRERHSGFEYMF